VKVLGVTYMGRGSSLNYAKEAAAAKALKSIYNIRLALGVETPTDKKENTTATEGTATIEKSKLRSESQ